MTARGVVRAGRIEITEGKLPPEGSSVEVEIRPAPEAGADPVQRCFGLWRDRTDLVDSRDYVERVRADQWRR